MDFLLSDVQQDIVEMAKKFAEKEIAPIVDEDEQNSHFRKELFPKFGQAGFIGATTDSKYGGSELGALEYALLLEEIAYQSSGYAVSLSVTNMIVKILDESGTEAQKEKYLKPLITGAKIGAFCLTEANSGSDAGSLQTTAKLEGNHYLINGVKQFITNGEYADYFVVMARTGGAGSKGVSAFLVEKDFPGVKGGKLEKKMGMRVSPTQEMLFEKVKVPKENLIGKEGEGFKTALCTLDAGRVSIATIAVGIARAALDKAIQYAKEREQFQQKIMEFQAISFLLADMATELEAAKLLTRQAANRLDNNLEFSKEASMAKLKATETCMRITTDAVQVFGGYGYMEEYQVERFMREAKMLELVEGTSQIQKIVISRKL